MYILLGCSTKDVVHVKHGTLETRRMTVALVFCRSKVFVREFQLDAGERRRSPQVPQPGRLQEEKGADLMC